MRIAIATTNIRPTPPIKEKTIYAPLWIAHYLAEGLLKKGHRVFLFGSSDSKSRAKLISDTPAFKKNKEWFRTYQKLDETTKDKENTRCLSSAKWKEVLVENYELLLATKIFEMEQKGMFDIIQFHSQPIFLHFAGLMKTPVVATVHDPNGHPFESGVIKNVLCALPKNINFVSLSNAQRKPLQNKLNYVATVYNGIDTKRFSFDKKGGDYLAFAGRILPRKGVHLVVEVARKTGNKLKIAGELSYNYKKYWQKQIKPYLSRKITYEGLLSQKQLIPFYQKAKALLMPVLVEEPFGLVMTEAMACGTPVIAFNRGSVKEVVKNGKTGFIVKNTKEMIKAVKKIDQIDRKECRKWVEENFTIEKMVDNYEKVYLKILKKKA